MLGLKVETDPTWAEAAMGDLNRVLIDHAHCEMKAASNALSLATRCLENGPLVRALTVLAREEIDHFHRVLGFLEARGLTLGPPEIDTYAAALRRAIGDEGAPARETRGSKVVDRLLVGALIEARSCERFKLLAEALERAGERDMSAFYRELLAAEARHHREFVDLAIVAGSTRAAVLARLDVLAEREAAIVRGLSASPPGERATIHG